MSVVKRIKYNIHCTQCDRKLTSRPERYKLCGVCAGYNDFDSMEELKNDPRTYIGATTFRSISQRLEDVERWEKRT
jgi:hypothetical protein